MATTNLIPDHYTIQFDRNWKLAIQQLMERLRAFATVHSGCTGKAKTHNRIEAEEMEEQTERLAPTAGDELKTAKRWVFPRPHQKTTFLDEWDADLLGETVLPTGDAVRVHRAAAGRKMDLILLQGIYGTNMEGGDNDPGNLTSKTLLADNQIAINKKVGGTEAGSVGMTLDKLILAKDRFGEQEVYGQDQHGAGEVLCGALAQNHLTSLLADTTLTSADYADVKALIKGEIDEFMGFRFVRTQQLPANSGADGTLAYFWAKTHVHLDIWADFRSRMSIRDDLSEAIQIRSKLMAGACRSDDKAVVEVDCLTV